VPSATIVPAGVSILVPRASTPSSFAIPVVWSSHAVTTRYPARQSARLRVGPRRFALTAYPGEFPGAADDSGQRYGEYSPFGFNGGFYYTKLSYSW